MSANVREPVQVNLGEFGLTSVTPTSVRLVVDFVYRGEVIVPGERMDEVCHTAHALGES